MLSLRVVRVGFAVAAAVAMVLTAGGERQAHESPKPNIVVFMVDDLDMPTLQVLLAKG